MVLFDFFCSYFRVYFVLFFCLIKVCLVLCFFMFGRVLDFKVIWVFWIFDFLVILYNLGFRINWRWDYNWLFKWVLKEVGFWSYSGLFLWRMLSVWLLNIIVDGRDLLVCLLFDFLGVLLCYFWGDVNYFVSKCLNFIWN